MIFQVYGYSRRRPNPPHATQAPRRARHVPVVTPGSQPRKQPAEPGQQPTASYNKEEHVPAPPVQHPVLTPAASRPLHNRRLIVTGPRQYASKLAGLLLDAGARPLWVPCVDISALDDPRQIADLQHALSDLSAFSHIAFTSKNGINAVLTVLESLYGSFARSVVEESGVRLCALGADAQALEQAGHSVHVQPSEASTQGLVRELAVRGELEGAHVLCPAPHVSGGLEEPPVIPRFVAALSDGGAAVTRVDAYVTRAGVTADDIAPEAALMRGGCIDAIVFTSTAEAQGLVSALGGTDVLQALVSDQGIVLAAHGPYTAAGVSAVTGLTVDVIGTAFGSFHGVVAALEAHFTPPPSTADRSWPNKPPPPPPPSQQPPGSVTTTPPRAASPMPQQASERRNQLPKPATGAQGDASAAAVAPSRATDAPSKRQQLSGMDHLQLLTPT